MFYNFLIEIRNRGLLLFLTWFSTLIICYLYKEIVLFLFVKPSLIFFEKNSLYFIFTNLTEIFSTYIQISYFIANQIIFIFILYHLIIFITPGLYYFEYKNLKNIFKINIFFWIMSILILNILILPISCQFFLSYQKTINNLTLNFYFEAKINEYLKFYILSYYLCNLNFQFFVFFFICFNYIKKNLQLLKRIRKSFYFLFFLLATTLTPPDIYSQLFISLNTIIFYEISIIYIIFKTNLLKLIV